MATMLIHPNGVAGTTIMDDGVKAHWTEGRSSEVVVVYPDGRMLAFPVSGIGVSPEGKMILSKLDEIEGSDFDQRDMTPEEVREWELARNPNFDAKLDNALDGI